MTDHLVTIIWSLITDHCVGSAIGEGPCLRKAGAAPGVTAHLAGFIRVNADSLAAAKPLLPGNPVYEAGGTVEIRELQRGD